MQSEYPQTIPIASPANEFFANSIIVENHTDSKITIIISSSPVSIENSYLQADEEAIWKVLEPKETWDYFKKEGIYVTALVKNSYYCNVLKMNLEVKRGYKVSLQQRHIDNPLHREITLYSWTQCICI